MAEMEKSLRALSLPYSSRKTMEPERPVLMAISVAEVAVARGSQPLMVLRHSRAPWLEKVLVGIVLAFGAS